ncbi:MAG: hypothetical protein R8N50_02625 [Alphaproteobacteria bacterium]|nr:hypothetical protein [Alphaproteobacteria bacterium]
MKKIFGFLICTLLISVRVYAEADIPTDKSYTFDRANVASVLAEFIEDEKKAEKAADKYNELSNNSENAISAVDFVDVCVAGGMNMKLTDGSGYMKCLDMFMKLIEMQNLDAGGFDMYCPATGNALKSITDKTQVGDVCGGTPDTYIEYGYVTLKTDDKNGQHKYVCTCTPQSCIDGYYWNKEKHQCSVKDKEGYCVRHILGSFEYKKDKFPTSGVGINDRLKKSNAYYNDKYAQMNASFDAFSRCVEYGANQGCRIRGALASADFGNKYRVICNPANYEIEADKKIQEDKEKKHKAELAENMTYYEVCGKDKGMTGAVCVNDFAALVVNMQQAQGLAKLYARNKSDDIIQCKTKPRMDAQTSHSINIHAMGMSSTTFTPYVQCTSLNSNKFYEFRFSNVDGNIDATNHKNFKRGICKIFGYKYVSKKPEAPADNHKFDICDGIKDESACNKLNQVISAGNIGYVASWGPLGYKTGRTGYQITGRNFPYCVLSENVAKGSDGYLLDEKTAFGLNGRVFLNAGVQRKGSNEIKQQIRTYVENTMGKGNVKSFSCEETYHTVKLKDRRGTDDMVRCTINDQVVEFFFDDLSESWGTYDKSGREAMNCIAWGGTFTGKKCIGLDEKMCYKVRGANAQSCPECKKIQWNSKAKICELPASVSATNLKRGLTYSAIVGGAVASVIITIGTAGAGGVTAGTAIIMLVETAGAAIELGAQINIDNKADKFFVESANCNSESCAKELVKKYLTELARIGRDLTEAEADATDQEMARLIGLIPTNSDWWIKNLRTEDGKSLLEKADDGVWTAAQVWRAVGIGMQFAGVLSSITGWIIKKAGYLEKTLDRTSKILLNAARTAEQNIVKVDKLDDVGKEWYKLWQDYAPKDQTFEQFKAMANGDLDKMKQMLKSWTPRSKRPIINAQIDKQLDDINADVSRRQKIWDDLMDKYDIDAIPDDPDELAQLYKQHPDLEQATKNLNYARAQQKKLEDARGYYNNTSYSTNDPEFTRTMESQIKIDKLKKELEDLYSDEWIILPDDTPEIVEKKRNMPQRVDEINKEIEELEKSVPTQWEVAEKHQLQNLGNVVKERADDFAEIIANNPEIKAKLDEKVWSKLTDQERADVAQKVLDEYAVKTNTPRAAVGLDVGDYGGYHTYGTNNVVFNPNEQIQHYDGMVETMAHEHGHLIDDLAPNEGALGEQYNYYTSKIYSNQRDDGYRVALTEQSSFKTGPNVSHEATGTTHSSYGKEHELEGAKVREQAFQKVNQDNKEAFDKEVEGHAAMGALGFTGLGVEVGTTKSIIEKKNEKKNEKKDKKKDKK